MCSTQKLELYLTNVCRNSMIFFPNSSFSSQNSIFRQIHLTVVFVVTRDTYLPQLVQKLSTKAKMLFTNLHELCSSVVTSRHCFALLISSCFVVYYICIAYGFRYSPSPPLRTSVKNVTDTHNSLGWSFPNPSKNGFSVRLPFSL